MHSLEAKVVCTTNFSREWSLAEKIGHGERFEVRKQEILKPGFPR
jgi:hypothetical protein